LGRRRERSSVEASGETARRVGNEWAWRAGKGSGSGSGRARRAAAREETAARRWEAVKGGSGVEVGEYDGGQGAGWRGGGGGGDGMEVEGVASGGMGTDV
jgi:hypothetical protein